MPLFFRLLSVFAAVLMIGLHLAGPAEAGASCNVPGGEQPSYLYLDAGASSCRIGNEGETATYGARLLVGIEDGEMLLDPSYRAGGGEIEAAMSCDSGTCLSMSTSAPYYEVWSCATSCRMHFDFEGENGTNRLDIDFDQSVQAISVAATGPDYGDIISTSTSLSGLTSGVAEGDVYSLSVSVSPIAAAGLVSIYDDGVEIVSGDVIDGSFGHDFVIAAGSHQFTATFFPRDAGRFSGSTSQLLSVYADPGSDTRAASSTEIEIDERRPLAGTEVRVQAFVSPSDATGTVHFLVNGSEFATGAISSNGRASANFTVPDDRSFVFSADYEGDDRYLASSSGSVTAVGTYVDAEARIVLDTRQYEADADVVAHVDILGLPGGARDVEAPGSVRFWLFVEDDRGDYEVTLGTRNVVSGRATITFSAGSDARDYELHAEYLGGPGYQSQLASPVVLTVFDPGEVESSTTVLTASETTPPAGANITFTATLNGDHAGSFELLENGDVIAVFAKSTATAGTYVMAAKAGVNSYRARFVSSNVNVVADSISGSVSIEGTGQQDTSMTLSAEPDPVRAGRTIDLTASITPNPGAGDVVFRVDGTEVARTPVAGTGIARASVAADWPEGARSLTADFTGTSYFESASASAAFEVIADSAGDVPTSVILVADPDVGLAAGDITSLGVSVSPAWAAGDVIITLDGDVLVIGAVSGGSFSHDVLLAEGTVNFQAEFVPSDPAAFLGSQSGIVALEVGPDPDAGKAESVVAIAVSAASSVVNDPETFTATVTPATATGSVRFLVDGSEVGSAQLVSGVASLGHSFSMSGTHAVSAAYDGNATLKSSSSGSVAVQVARDDLVVRMGSNKESYTAGETAVITFDVDRTDATGRVTFSTETTTLGTDMLENGHAQISYTLPHTVDVTATFDGSGAYNPTTESIQILAAENPTNTAISLSNTSPNAGDRISIVSAVSPAAAQGAVRFEDNGEVIATVNLLAGLASTTVTATPGTHAFQAHFVPADPLTYGPSSSALAGIVVASPGPEPVVMSLEAEPENLTVGQSTGLTARLAPPVPSGTVRVLKDGNELTTAAILDGLAQVNVQMTNVGTSEFQVHFDGDDDFDAASSNTVQVTAAKQGTTLSMDLGDGPHRVGDSLEIAASVNPSSAGGRIELWVDGVMNQATTLSAGSAVFSYPLDSAGGVSFSLVYDGDETHAASSLPGEMITVERVPVQIAISAASATGLPGDRITLSASLNPADAAGEIVFMRNGSEAGRAILSAGTAQLDLLFDSPGLFEMGAAFAGDDRLAPATAETVQIEIEKLTPEIVLDGGATVEIGSPISISGQTSAGYAAETGAEVVLELTIDGSSEQVVVTPGGDGRFATQITPGGTGDVFAEARTRETDRYAAARSETATWSVVRRNASLTLDLDGTSYASGQLATMSAVISETGATGGVSFLRDGVEIGVEPLIDGRATFYQNLTGSGRAEFSARYDGDAVVAPALSNPVVVGIDAELVETELAVSSSTAQLDDEVTFTVTVSDPDWSGTAVLFEVSSGSPVEIDRASVAGPIFAFERAMDRVGPRSFRVEIEPEEGQVAEPSNTVSVETDRYATSLVISADKASVVSGETVRLTARLEGGNLPTGEIEFLVDGIPVRTVPLGSGAQDFVFEDVGSHSIAARFLGDADHAPAVADAVSVEVTRKPVSLSLDLPGGPHVHGDVISISASLDATMATGEVVFFLDDIEVGRAPISSGGASLDLGARAGSHSVRASYSGDDRHMPAAAGPEVLVVNAAESQVRLSLTPSQVAIGNEVLASASIAPSGATGEVLFYLDGEEIGSTAVADDAASLSFMPEAAGDFEITARFTGSPEINPGLSGPAELIVSRRTFAISLGELPTGVAVGDTVLVEGRLSESDYRGEIHLAVETTGGYRNHSTIPTPDGLFAFAVSADAAGALDLRLTGDRTSIYEAPEPVDASLVIERRKATVTLALDKRDYELNETAQLSATLDDAQATGEIVFERDGAEIGRAALSNGMATVSHSLEGAGIQSFRAIFGGDARNQPAESDPVEVAVAVEVITVDLAATAAETVYGSVIDLDMEVDDPAWTGEASLFEQTEEGWSLVETVSLDAPAHQFSVPADRVGSRVFRAEISTAETQDALPSAPVTIDTTKRNTILSLSLAANSVFVGDDVVVEAAIQAGIGAAGDVVFLVDGQERARVALEDEAATATLSFNQEGTFGIALDYLGDENHNGAMADRVDLVVARRAGTGTVVASAERAQVGDAVEFTAAMEDATAEGDVVFSVDGIDVATVALAEGRAELSHVFDAAGTFEVAARYLGSDRHAPAELSGATTIEIDLAAVSGELLLSGTTVVPGQSLDARVVFATTGLTGEVVFLVDDVEVARAPIADHTASAEISFDAVGRYGLRAVYSGGPSHAPWASAVIEVESGLTEISLVLRPSKSRVVAGERISLVADFDPAPSEGSLRILRGAELIADIAVDGSSSYGFDDVEVVEGQPFMAHFSGSDAAASASSGQIEVEIQTVYTLELSAEKTSLKAGEQVALSAHVTPVEAEGTVIFRVGEGEIGRAGFSEGLAGILASFDAGNHRVSAEYLTPDEEVLTASIDLVVESRTGALFEERREVIARVMNSEIGRAAQARHRHMETIMTGVRDRLRRPQVEVTRDTPIYDPTRFIPMRFSGDLRATNGRAQGRGSYYSARPVLDGQMVLNGSFDAASEDGFGTSGQFNGSIAYEVRRSGDVMLGVMAGVEAGKTSVQGDMPGTVGTAGASLGVYGATRLGGSVVLDGYVSGAYLRHKIDISDDALAVRGTYDSTAIIAGATISGEHHLSSRLRFDPSASVRHSILARRDTDLEAVADGYVEMQEMLGETFSTSRLEAKPKMTWLMGRAGSSELSFSPNLICETGGCGYGIELGLFAPIGREGGHFKAGGGMEEVGGTRRNYLSLEMEVPF